MTLRAAAVLLRLHDAASTVWRRARLHARRCYLLAMVASAEFDQHCADQEAQRSGWIGQVTWSDMHAAQAAAARARQQVLRVEIARVEASLWPVRGAA